MTRAASGEEPKSVLFACTLNCIRSPIAAAILDHLAGGRLVVMSAGVRAGLPDPYAVAVMDERQPVGDHDQGGLLEGR